jgi:hypothetical protein
LTLAGPWTGDAFGDHDVADILAVDRDGGQRSTVTILLATVFRVADMDLDAARGKQFADPALGDVAQPAFGIAFRVVGFRGIDISDPDMGLVDDNCVAVDDQRLRESDASCGKNC